MDICYVLINGMLATSVSWPNEMWASATQAAKIEHKTDNKPIHNFFISDELATIKTHGGISFQPDFCITDPTHSHKTFDLVYVPALWRNPQKVIPKAKKIIEWLKFQYENGAILCGVGTGVCLLAETGLLDHKAATTHWYYFDTFAKRYPNVDLKRQYFITEAEPIYCAASINSLADLTVHFIQRFINQKTARHIERHFSHEIRRAYDRTSFMDKNNQNHPDEAILQSQLWMRDNLNQAISIKQLAAQNDMSERNFARRFQAAANMTPNQYLQHIRIDTAQDLLQYSNLNIVEIAERTGFNDLSYFAKTFKKLRSISPSDYRKTVRAKLFTNTVN